jgi:hypothetical protein
MDIPRVSDKVMHIPGVREIIKQVGIKTANREKSSMDIPSEIFTPRVFPHGHSEEDDKMLFNH